MFCLNEKSLAQNCGHPKRLSGCEVKARRCRHTLCIPSRRNADLRACCAVSGVCFLVSTGLISSFESNFKGYIRRAKIEKDVTPHCLRNNFAKRCLMNGMDIYTLSRLLGHSSVTVTEEAYLDLTDNDIGQRYQHFSPVNSM